ncbi:MAG TPA: methionine--tRNA ligase [Anaerolineae bacterium]|nr:methionine--tRNA ligase [Anaerolineae bacterium]HOQ97508.1 methionine--tRNA ligase [Anaerolineae bacterium]HPL28878.1 methionine--tRNA ligase [Anaerolineae bacterium]
MANTLGRFYVTTPIYYMNAQPHLGHAYTTVLCDVMARYHRLWGDDTYFLTGSDEHGDKIAQAALACGESPQAFVDRLSAAFRETWVRLGISSDDFIRTTEPRHQAVVQRILQEIYDRGDIYFGSYGGQYCLGCERFLTERELVDGRCPDHGTEPTRIEEKNYFFRMGKYQDWLVAYLTEHPEVLQPEQYRGEVLAFLRSPLEDLCISRPKSRLTWGIPLPFDEDYVTYVWFDALINYISALGYPEGERYARYWPVCHHVTAKDILKPHAIYWPTMLHAAGIPMYHALRVHGYWGVDQAKMSKSRGNVVRPLELSDKYGVDAFRYFVIREMTFGQDASFNEEAFVTRYNAELANDLGNLLNRTLHMVGRYCEGMIPAPADEPGAERQAFIERALATPAQVQRAIEQWNPQAAVLTTLELVRAANLYLEQRAPWAAFKRGDVAQVNTTLYDVAEALRWVALLLHPVMPGKMAALWQALGQEGTPRWPDEVAWGILQPGAATRRGEVLFPRQELALDEAANQA